MNNQRKLRLPMLLILIKALAMLAASCSTGAPPVAGVTDSPAALTPGGGIPAPLDMPRQPSYQDEYRSKLGSEGYGTGDGYETNTAPDGSRMVYTPPNNPELIPAIRNTARGAYTLESIAGYDGPAQVFLDWSTPPDPADLWIGVSDYAANHWDWHNPADPAMLSFPGETAGYRHPADGVITVIIVLTGGAPAVLDSLRFGPEYWEYEVVDGDGATGYNTSLALDDGELPHIAYYDKDNTSLRYAHFDGASWSTETVADFTSDVECFPSIAVSSLGGPQIAYRDEDVPALRRAYKSGDTWLFTDVDSSPLAGYMPALVVDETNGFAHITYGVSGGTYMYASESTFAWIIEPILTFAGAPTWASSLVLDELNQPHIALGSVGGVHYAWFDGAIWQSEPVGGITPFLYEHSLARQSDGTLHLAYNEGDDGKLYYAKRSGGTWSAPELVIDQLNLGTNLSLGLSPDGLPRLSCYGEGLNFIWHDGGQWNRIKFDQGWVGLRTSLVVSADGMAHLSYQNRDDEDLKYASQLLELNPLDL